MTAEWPAHELDHLGACPVCGTASRRVIDTSLRSTSGPGGWTLWRCGGCDCGYIDPRPTSESIDRLYRTYYTHEPTIELEPAAKTDTRTRLLESYLGARFGYTSATRSTVGRFVVPLIPGARGMAGQHVRSLPSRRVPGRLLDVGCGNGSFLLRMRELGWHVEGLEVDPVAADVARGSAVDVDPGPMTMSTFPSAHFDAITLSHVIEHLHDPVAVLQACANALRPGGLIWVATPNLDAAGRRFMGRTWAPLDPPRHLVLFTRPSLRRALNMAGFSSISEPPPTLQATRWTFGASLDIADGGDGHTIRRLPARIRLRALSADLATIATRTASEEVCMMAMRRGEWPAC